MLCVQAEGSYTGIMSRSMAKIPFNGMYLVNSILSSSMNRIVLKYCLIIFRYLRINRWCKSRQICHPNRSIVAYALKKAIWPSHVTEQSELQAFPVCFPIRMYPAIVHFSIRKINRKTLHHSAQFWHPTSMIFHSISVTMCPRKGTQSTPDSCVL